METYTLLRAFADSWFLILMFTFFLGTAIWAFLPSQRSAREDASEIPFRDDQPGCANNCADCTCKFDILEQVNG